jgi:adenosine deaminase CECR1
MVGKADMSIFGWKQLVLWSMEHSCLSESEREEVMQKWETLWVQFLEWVIQTYGNVEVKA